MSRGSAIFRFEPAILGEIFTLAPENPLNHLPKFGSLTMHQDAHSENPARRPDA